MVYGRARIQKKPLAARMGWIDLGEYVEFAPDAAITEKECVMSEKAELEAFRCLKCSATLISTEYWP
jgi:hypothetical protein